MGNEWEKREGKPLQIKTPATIHLRFQESVLLQTEEEGRACKDSTTTRHFYFCDSHLFLTLYLLLFFIQNG